MTNLNQAKPVLYFYHGLPGSPRDANLLSKCVREKYHVKAVDYLVSYDEEGLDGIIQHFDEVQPERLSSTVHVAGFSLGAMIAMHVAATRPDRISKLTLISPAAPLELGDFLPQMAGKPVFQMARSSPKLLVVVTFLQAHLSRIFPGFLIKQMFAKAAASEKDLLSDSDFQQVIADGMKHSFHNFPKAYRGLLEEYVGDWSDVLSRIRCEAEIWHGDQDTWSPIEMSYALRSNLEGSPKFVTIPDAGHYTALTRTRIQMRGSG